MTTRCRAHWQTVYKVTATRISGIWGNRQIREEYDTGLTARSDCLRVNQATTLPVWACLVLFAGVLVMYNRILP